MEREKEGKEGKKDKKVRWKKRKRGGEKEGEGERVKGRGPSIQSLAMIF